MAKEQSHSTLDAELMNPGQSAFTLALYLGCFASALLVIITWLALLALMSAGVIEWQGWLFVAGPVVSWVLLLAGPAMVKARRGALATLDAIAGTAEAYLARAGWSIDLNNDGYIGHYQPMVNPPQIAEHRPILHTVNGQARLLAQAAALAIKEAEELTPDQGADEPDPPRLVRHVWSLPNGAKVTQAALEDFSDRLSLVGWNRKEWVGNRKPFDRQQYDGLMLLLDQAGIIEGRGKGSAGQLVVKRAADRRRVLGLMPTATTGPADAGLMGRYEHIE